ncbi:hypothetical protein MTO96_027615 [Rhipicephalus appendiculatus]
MAAIYLQKLAEVQPKGPYHIVGYSFGATVAFEIAVQLQASGASVASLTLLDGAPHYMAVHTAHHRSRFTGSKDEEESALFCAFLMQYLDIDYIEVRKQMNQYPNWDAKQEAATDILLKAYPNVHPSRQDVATATRVFYEFLKAGSNYKPHAKFHGDVVLIKASRPRKMASQLPSDYGLSECCNGKVEVKEVDGLHENFILGEGAKKCAAIITLKLFPLLGLPTADEELMVKEFHRRQLVRDHHKDHRYCELQHRHQTKWQPHMVSTLVGIWPDQDFWSTVETQKLLPLLILPTVDEEPMVKEFPSPATCQGPPQGSSLLRASTSASNKMAVNEAYEEHRVSRNGHAQCCRTPAPLCMTPWLMPLNTDPPCQLSLLAKVDLAFFWFRVSHLLHGTSFLQTVRFARAKECQVGDQTSCFPGSSYRNIKATIVTSFNSSIEIEVDVPSGDENSTSYQDVWPSVASWHPLVLNLRKFARGELTSAHPLAHPC